MNYFSTTSNQALMTQALKSLKGKWGIAIGAWLIFFILTDFQVGWEWQGDNGGDYKVGLKIIGLKMITIDKKLAEKHYQEFVKENVPCEFYEGGVKKKEFKP